MNAMSFFATIDEARAMARAQERWAAAEQLDDALLAAMSAHYDRADPAEARIDGRTSLRA